MNKPVIIAVLYIVEIIVSLIPPPKTPKRLRRRH
jgi:hypothetical protein